MKLLFNPVKGVLDQGVMHGFDQDAPLCPHPEAAVGIDNMPDQRAVPPGNHFKKMPAVEPTGETVSVKQEDNPATRRVFRHTVPHGAMAAPGTLLQQSVEFHGGPILHGPQLIRRPGECIEQDPDISCRCLNFAFVPVVDLHFLLPIVAR
jgi:hypothetical protein